MKEGMNLKRHGFVGFILCLFFASATSVFAAQGVDLVVGQVVARQGESVVVTIALDTNPGLTGMLLAVEYDSSRLRMDGIDSVVPGTTLNRSNYFGVDESTFRNNPFRVAWLEPRDNAAVGVLLNIEFDVLDNAPGGFAFVEVSAEVNNSRYTSLDVSVVQGGVYVSGVEEVLIEDEDEDEDEDIKLPDTDIDIEDIVRDIIPTPPPQSEVSRRKTEEWPVITPQVVNVPELPPEIKNVVADNIVFVTESEIPGTIELMAIPFERMPWILPETIVAYSISEDGIVQLVIPSLYDETNLSLRMLGLTNELYMISSNEISFYDVSTDVWYHRAVSFVASRELFSGIGNSLFAPQMTMTRGMFVAVLSRLDGIDSDLFDVSPFSDVNIEMWYGPSIAWAFSEGILGNPNEFRPYDYITREEMAVIFANYLAIRDFPLVDNDVPLFYDINQASYWARDAISAMRRHAIINGIGDNLYNPQGIATRAEVAQIFTNIVRAIVGLS